MKRLVINADDLGMCRGANLGILEAHRDGVVSSASLMANLPAFDHALHEVVQACPDLGIGLHLNLTCGAALLPAQRIPLLADRRGRFRHGFVGLYRLLAQPWSKAAAVAQIAAELRAQFDKVFTALSDRSLQRLDHVNGHQHVHMIPGIWRIALDLTAEFAAGTVRLSGERWPRGGGAAALGVGMSRGNLLKRQWLAHLAQGNLQYARAMRSGHVRPDLAVFGIMQSGRWSEALLSAQLEQLTDGDAEILIHPSLGPQDSCAAGVDDLQALSAADRRFQRDPWRRRELAALCAPRLRQRLDEQGVRLVRFSDIAESAASPVGAAT